MPHRRWILFLVLAGALVVSHALAQPSTPQVIKTQGYLSDSSGGSAEPANGTYTMTFDLYDADPGGLLISTVGPLLVDVVDGLYDVDLAFVSADFDASVRYLEITIDPDGGGSAPPETLTPRIQVVSAPYAYVADRLDGMDSTDFAPGVHAHAGGDITSGIVVESFIDPAIARDSEVVGTVLASDGPGSGLDADLLDGLEASAFLTSVTDVWVDTAGDTMTGDLALDSGVDLHLGRDVRKGGALFLHNHSTDGLALGEGAMRNASVGVSNTAIGKWAMRDNTSGRLNTALGTNALRANSDGEANVALGVNALLWNTNGWENIAIGFEAGREVQGSWNILIGKQAGIGAGNRNIHIGAGGVAGESDTIRLGAGARQNRAFIAGIRGVTTGEADAIPVVVDSNGQLGTVSSSVRVKEQIHDIGPLSNRLLALRPVAFRYKAHAGSATAATQYGLIAEEVAEVMPELVVYDRDGNPETVRYHLLNTMLLNELQRLYERVDALERQIVVVDEEGESR